MKSVITKDNVRFFAYVNDGFLKGPARGLVIDFKGLGGMAMYGVFCRAGPDGRLWGHLGRESGCGR